MKTNYLYRSGSLVTDPRYLVKVTDSPKCFGQQYGTLDFRGMSSQKLVEYTVFKDSSLTFGEVPEFCEEHNPEIEVEVREKDESLKIRWNDDPEEVANRMKEIEAT